MTQLYLVKNTINGKYYIGVHEGNIFDDNYWGTGTLIKRALKKYGKDNFEKEVICEYDNPKEAYLFERVIVNSGRLEDPNCYNLVIGGDYRESGKFHPAYGYRHSEETKQLISETSKEKLKINPNPYFTGEKNYWEGKKRPNFAGKNHPMYGKSHTEEVKERLRECNLGKTQSEKTKNKLRTPVIQLSLDGDVIKIWNSKKEAEEELGIYNISKVCKGQRNSAGGFKWKFKEYKRRHSTKKRKVLQYDLDGNFLNEYSSLAEAGRNVNSSTSSLSRACRGKEYTCRGFKWEYK